MVTELDKHRGQLFREARREKFNIELMRRPDDTRTWLQITKPLSIEVPICIVASPEHIEMMNGKQSIVVEGSIAMNDKVPAGHPASKKFQIWKVLDGT